MPIFNLNKSSNNRLSVSPSPQNGANPSTSGSSFASTSSPSQRLAPPTQATGGLTPLSKDAISNNQKPESSHVTLLTKPRAVNDGTDSNVSRNSITTNPSNQKPDEAFFSRLESILKLPPSSEKSDRLWDFIVDMQDTDKTSRDPKDGKTVLLKIASCDPKMTHWLINMHGVDCNFTDNSKQNVLHHLVKNQSWNNVDDITECIKAAKKKGVDVNAPDITNETAVHHAIHTAIKSNEKNSTKVITLLKSLTPEADFTRPGKNNLTPEDALSNAISNDFNNFEYYADLYQWVQGRRAPKQLSREDFIQSVKNGRTDFSNCNLQNVDFRNIPGLSKLTLNFFRANLEGANFEGVYIENSNFSGANLNKANMENAWLRNNDFSNATMKDAIASCAKLCDCNLNGTQMQNIKLITANLDGVYGTSANLTNAEALASTWGGSQLDDLIAPGIDLTKAKVSTYYNSGNNKKHTTASWKNANLENMIADESDFGYSSLEGSNVNFSC
ncbi:MAG: hypothetical protein C5B47_03290 [Verrucomicrobia bacterium]|nr:MAG: hypothetical protein C5B47_03290 [Verrucomicrobiota bacterium]